MHTHLVTQLIRAGRDRRAREVLSKCEGNKKRREEEVTQWRRTETHAHEQRSIEGGKEVGIICKKVEGGGALFSFRFCSAVLIFSCTLHLRFSSLPPFFAVSFGIQLSSFTSTPPCSDQLFRKAVAGSWRRLMKSQVTFREILPVRQKEEESKNHSAQSSSLTHSTDHSFRLIPLPLAGRPNSPYEDGRRRRWDGIEKMDREAVSANPLPPV
mmetsp:Transcript_17023/g.34544  ORF Transcript_17023/g.34544 Transcript_17023/m.34544 type:complete len:212 (-) Transcript_17023:1409-2044(-)